MKNMRLNVFNRSVIILALIAVLAPACLKPGPPNVGVKSLAAEIVFGIPELEEPPLPPDFFPEPEPMMVIGDESKKPIATAPVFGGECEKALINEVDAEATKDLQGQVSEGQYRWKQEGDFDGGGRVGRLNLDPFTTRTISEFRKGASAKDFTYTVEQTEQFGVPVKVGFSVFQSRPKAPSAPTEAYYQNTSKNSLNGIFMSKWTRGGGENGETAEPNPSVLYLPLPVPEGVTFTTTAADPDNFFTIRHEASVRAKERYDACGKLVDGWLVRAFQTISFGSETVTRVYEYAIATQYGGLMVADHVEAPCSASEYDTTKRSCKTTPRLRYRANTATLTPDPL